jgi:hypothetical protein
LCDSQAGAWGVGQGLVSPLFAAAASRVQAQDQDQEVKESAMMAACKAVAVLGDSLAVEVPSFLQVSLLGVSIVVSMLGVPSVVSLLGAPTVGITAGCPECRITAGCHEYSCARACPASLACAREQYWSETRSDAKRCCVRIQ